MTISLIQTISIDELNYLKNDSIINKLKNILSLEDIYDLKLTPFISNEFIVFFQESENQELLLKSIYKENSFFLKPNKIDFYELDINNNYLNGVYFIFTYELEEHFNKKIDCFIKDKKDFFKNNFKSKTYIKVKLINRNKKIIFAQSGTVSKCKLNELINYCNNKKYTYELKIEHDFVNYNIKMEISNND